MTFDVNRVRAAYPALSDGYAYLDGAAGTQVPSAVIEAIAGAYRAGIGNAGGIYSIAVKQLPALSEKQIKFYETQEKKLKALQKSAQKEQSDALGVFEAASADFQKLLADASQVSLQAALSERPKDRSGESA